jgi:hypothetical protein
VSRAGALRATLVLLAALACGIKAPPRPPLPARPGGSSEPAQPAAEAPPQAKDCPGCPPPEGEKPAAEKAP